MEGIIITAITMLIIIIVIITKGMEVPNFYSPSEAQSDTQTYLAGCCEVSICVSKVVTGTRIEDTMETHIPISLLLDFFFFFDLGFLGPIDMF